jgi:hypothetical protein
MRFVGQAEVLAFLRDCPAETERLQSWVAEIQHHNWRNFRELLATFQDVDASRPPLTIFRLNRPPLHIETLIDFRTNVLMLLAINQPQLRSETLL